MNFIIASNNRGKLKEFRDKFDINFIAYRDILGDIDIEESGDSFPRECFNKSKRGI